MCMPVCTRGKYCVSQSLCILFFWDKVISPVLRILLFEIGSHCVTLASPELIAYLDGLEFIVIDASASWVWGKYSFTCGNSVDLTAFCGYQSQISFDYEVILVCLVCWSIFWPYGNTTVLWLLWFLWHRLPLVRLVTGSRLTLKSEMTNVRQHADASQLLMVLYSNKYIVS